MAHKRKFTSADNGIVRLNGRVGDRLIRIAELYDLPVQYVFDALLDSLAEQKQSVIILAITNKLIDGGLIAPYRESDE